jgi:hypothetical protein
MNMKYRNTSGKDRSCAGFTMIELTFAMALNLIIVMAAGILLVGGNRGWQNVYNAVNGKTKQDALAATLAFGNIGRKSNRLSYQIYKITANALIPATTKTSDPQEVVSGDAIEFRYWDVALDEDDTHNLMDESKKATAYALFYIEAGNLKVDYGPYPPGAAPAGGGAKNTVGVTTETIAENVTPGDVGVGPFSHTVISGVGQGSVRINLVITDPQTGKTTKVMTSTLMRNLWPR